MFYGELSTVTPKCKMILRLSLSFFPHISLMNNSNLTWVFLFTYFWCFLFFFICCNAQVYSLVKLVAIFDNAISKFFLLFELSDLYKIAGYFFYSYNPCFLMHKLVIKSYAFYACHTWFVITLRIALYDWYQRDAAVQRVCTQLMQACYKCSKFLICSPLSIYNNADSTFICATSPKQPWIQSTVRCEAYNLFFATTVYSFFMLHRFKINVFLYCSISTFYGIHPINYRNDQ